MLDAASSEEEADLRKFEVLQFSISYLEEKDKAGQKSGTFSSSTMKKQRETNESSLIEARDTAIDFENMDK